MDEFENGYDTVLLLVCDQHQKCLDASGTNGRTIGLRWNLHPAMDLGQVLETLTQQT